MSRQTGPSPSVGVFGISLGSTVPQNETQGSHFLQTLRGEWLSIIISWFDYNFVKKIYNTTILHIYVHAYNASLPEIRLVYKIQKLLNVVYRA